MINLTEFKEEYKKYKLYKSRLEQFKKEKWAVYSKDKKNINTLYDEYIQIEDPAEAKEFQKSHMNLRLFLIYNFLIQRYKTEVHRSLNNRKLFKEGECYVEIVDESKKQLYLYDVINDEGIGITHLSVNEEYFLKTGLEKASSFAGTITKEEFPLLKVIYSDIKSGAKTPEGITARISIELLKANIFDNYVEPEKPTRIQKQIRLKFEENYQRYTNKEITYEKYLITYYYYLILRDHNVEKIYENAPDDMKKYVLDAYEKLSSLKGVSEDFPFHERTKSPLINKRILSRRKKKPEQN